MYYKSTPSARYLKGNIVRASDLRALALVARFSPCALGTPGHSFNRVKKLFLAWALSVIWASKLSMWAFPVASICSRLSGIMSSTILFDFKISLGLRYFLGFIVAVVMVLPFPLKTLQTSLGNVCSSPTLQLYIIFLLRKLGNNT